MVYKVYLHTLGYNRYLEDFLNHFSLPELKHHPKRKSVPPIQCKRIEHPGKLRAALPKVKPEREEDNSTYFEGTRLYNPVEGSTKPEKAICQKSPPHNSPDSVF